MGIKSSCEFTKRVKGGGKMGFPNIEAERGRLGFTKKEFAKQIGVSTKTYYNWIDGITPIPSDALMKLSSMCHVSVDYLLNCKHDTT